MKAEALLKEGSVEQSLSALKEAIRDNPSDVNLRVFLFQLFSVNGQYDKAMDQLNLAGEMDAETLLMVQAYRGVLLCEQLRQDVFKGNRTPLFFGQPESYVATLFEALKQDALGNHSNAATLREKAYEGINIKSGKINGESFEWLADADSRIGPFLEAVVNGKYYWIPWDAIEHVKLHRPSDLRDMVWIPAEFSWTNEGQAVGFIPVRYPGTENAEDGDLKLSRKTDWLEKAEQNYHGLGQRMFATESKDYSILDIEEIDFK